MAQIAELGLALLVHAELPGPIQRAAASRAPGDPRRYASYLASRPAAAEVEAVDLILDLCRETGCRVHIVHVSAAETLEPLRAAKRAGLPVSAETCPHYLTFDGEEVADGCDADLVVFDPDGRFVVEPDRLRQRHPVTPYAGMTLLGVVRQTFVRGVCVYDSGAFPAGKVGTWVKP